MKVFTAAREVDKCGVFSFFASCGSQALSHVETQVPRWSQALPLASQAAWGSQPWVAESQVQKHFLFIVAGSYSALGEAFSVPFTMIDMEPRWLCCVTFVTSGCL